LIVWVGHWGFSLPSLPLSPCFHPHSRGAIRIRSVDVGRSRFSRCRRLFGALRFCSCRVEPGPGVRRSRRNSASGLLSANLFHCRSPFYLCLEHVDNLGAYSASRRRPAFSSHLLTTATEMAGYTLYRNSQVEAQCRVKQLRRRRYSPCRSGCESAWPRYSLLRQLCRCGSASFGSGGFRGSVWACTT
jgi:hypothetical protein